MKKIFVILYKIYFLRQKSFIKFMIKNDYSINNPTIVNGDGYAIVEVLF